VSADLLPWRRALIVCALVILADQALKEAVVSGLSPGEQIALLPGVELVSVRNRGVAFGLLGDVSGWLLVLVTCLALALLGAFFIRQSDRPGIWLGVGLIAGGALGNLVDRIRDGAVIDYLSLPLWPTFNLADVAITVGVALLILGKDPRRTGPGPDSSSGVDPVADRAPAAAGPASVAHPDLAEDPAPPATGVPRGEPDRGPADP
jgi:signal peptidase II